MIVFADMDGTFLNSKKEVTEASWSMLDALAEHGFEFVPCTGRPLSGVFAPILAHPAVHYVVTANGASVYQLCDDDPSDAERAERIYTKTLSRKVAHEVRRIARTHDVTFDIFADGACFLEHRMYERLDEFSGGDANIAASLKRTRVPVDEDPDVTIDRVANLERVALYWHNPIDRDEIAAGLESVDDIEITRSYPMNIEVMGAGVSKGTALTWLCDHLDTPIADSVGFGDNINDVSMIELAGTGVAMCNGEPEDRAAADVITDWDNDHDGVAKTVMGMLGA